MSRLLALTFDYGGETCSCLIRIQEIDGETQFVISNILCDNFDILPEPVIIQSTGGKIVPNELLHAEMPVIKAVETALNDYLRKERKT